LYSRLDASSLAGADAATLGTQIHLIGGTHTNELVPVFAYGYGAEQFLNTIDRTDLLYKRAYGLGESWGNGFVDNTDVFKVMNYAITGTPVPEPAVLAVWGIAAVFAMRRRRLD
jgi:alkaline phosphatase